MTQYKYLHETSPGISYLDHRLTPEVRAMLCAMASRAPAGGVKARYQQLVDAIAVPLWVDRVQDAALDCTVELTQPTWSGVTEPTLGFQGMSGSILLHRHSDGYTSSTQPECWDPDFEQAVQDILDQATLSLREAAEDILCTYPLHPKVQRFFDDFVGAYGHSSILELTGSPAVYVEGVSWFTSYLLFDSPLCAGQEFSTRAVQHKNWPMARECGDNAELGALHQDWFEIFEAEVKWWTEFFSHAENRAQFGVADKEPFRPALDRARWALPGTISTGSSHTTSLRERARVLDLGAKLNASGDEADRSVWADIRSAYRQALPGLADLGLREAVYKPSTELPHHLQHILSPLECDEDLAVRVQVTQTCPVPLGVGARKAERTYADPVFNQTHHVQFSIPCSIAVLRDWHRHRTAFPCQVNVVTSNGSIRIDPHYTPMSDLAKEKLPMLLARSNQAYARFLRDGMVNKAAMALPLGTQVVLEAGGGLRDFLYMGELRFFAHGANFEYKDQANQLLEQLRGAVGIETYDKLWANDTIT